MSTNQQEASRNAPCPCGSGKRYRKCCLKDSKPPPKPANIGGILTPSQVQEGIELEQQGRFREAGNLYERLLLTTPDHPALLWGQGRCLMHFRMREAAAKVLERAATVFPRHEIMIEDVASRLLLVGKPEIALRIAEKGVVDFPRNAAIACHRGDALLLLGREQEAILAFETLLEQHPDHPGASLSLVTSLRLMGEIDKALATTEAALARITDQTIFRAGLQNEFAQCQDALGDYPKAFEALQKSGATLLNTPEAREVDSDYYLHGLERNHQWVLENGIPEVIGEPHPDDSRLVFLLGFARSGTTLLESMLTAAPGIISSGEAALIDASLSTLISTGSALENVLDVIRPENTDLVNEARSKFWRKLKTSYGNDFDIFVDKQPMNTLYIPHIRMLFPKARIIFCVRDPRDVCLSCFAQWFALNGVNKLFLEWRSTADFYSRVMDYWFALEPLVEDAVSSVVYEDLVRDFPNQIMRLTQSARIPWDDAILSYAEANQERFFHTPSNRAVREKLSSDRSRRWKRYEAEFESVRDLLAPAVEKFGYKWETATRE